MSEIDHSFDVIRRLTSKEIQNSLEMATRVFTEDCELGLAEYSRKEIVSPETAQSLFDELKVSHRSIFWDSSFRDAIYLTWREMTSDSSPETQESLEAAYFALDSANQSLCCEIASDFEQLFFDKPLCQEVVESIEMFLKRGECGKALRIVRENAGLLPEKLLWQYRTIAWSRISRLDERFSPIFLHYQAAGGEANFLFPLDRPMSQTSEHVQIDLAFSLDTFASESLEAIEDYERDGTTIEPAELEAIMTDLDQFRGMKHFDSLSFRQYLLLAWKVRAS